MKNYHQIHFDENSDLQYCGRNGIARSMGLELLLGSTNHSVFLTPINSKGPAKSTYQEIDINALDDVINALISIRELSKTKRNENDKG